MQSSKANTIFKFPASTIQDAKKNRCSHLYVMFQKHEVDMSALEG